MWNYRVAKKEISGETLYGIVEVYYNDWGGVAGWSGFVDPNDWDEVSHLKATLKLMLEACDKPVFEHTIENSKEE